MLLMGDLSYECSGLGYVVLCVLYCRIIKCKSLGILLLVALAAGGNDSVARGGGYLSQLAFFLVFFKEGPFAFLAAPGLAFCLGHIGPIPAKSRK